MKRDLIPEREKELCESASSLWRRRVWVSKDVKEKGRDAEFGVEELKCDFFVKVFNFPFVFSVPFFRSFAKFDVVGRGAPCPEFSKLCNCNQFYVS